MFQRVGLFIALLLYSSIGLWGQNFLATIKFDSTSLLIGDQLRGSIILNAPQGQEASFPQVSEYWKDKNIEIFSVSDREKQNADGGTQIIKQSIALIFWDTGTYVLPSLPFIYVNGSETDTIWAEGPTISVQYPTGITGDSSYMAPIKSILGEDKNFWDYLYDYRQVFYIIIGVLALLGLGYGIMLLRAKAAANRNKLTPEGKALKDLETLLAADLIAKGQAGEYHTQISWILREYLNNRFRLKALESTTGEILEQVSFDQMNESLKRDLKEVLETADLVKYAKASPLASANSFAADYIKKLVETTLERLKEAAE